MKRAYAVKVEAPTCPGDNYSAWVPDVPGCASTGRTIHETLENMREALEMHLEGIVEDGGAIPESLSFGVPAVDVEIR